MITKINPKTHLRTFFSLVTPGVWRIHNPKSSPIEIIHRNMNADWESPKFIQGHFRLIIVWLYLQEIRKDERSNTFQYNTTSKGFHVRYFLLHNKNLYQSHPIFLAYSGQYPNDIWQLCHKRHSITHKWTKARV